ncbi:hypothetical protein [Streptomyces aidingensis]|uniref:Uncharacterized protein n=1 Tax=Streptomyces aidingensis TaxID=910347 RepID=A0A1I1PTJ4_9ACTN|nr:hypothetical protein [Streptomyces aidingensis]SFD13169.1 hypothetical protein SAMN05421773_11042 [Streptomyces aidingensis]
MEDIALLADLLGLLPTSAEDWAVVAAIAVVLIVPWAVGAALILGAATHGLLRLLHIRPAEPQAEPEHARPGAVPREQLLAAIARERTARRRAEQRAAALLAAHADTQPLPRAEAAS